MTLTQRMVDAGARVYLDTMDKTEECSRCHGKGYHHGFGEHGHDPDWCEVCGGPGYVWPANEQDATRAALIAALREWHDDISHIPELQEMVAHRITQLEQDNDRHA